MTPPRTTRGKVARKTLRSKGTQRKTLFKRVTTETQIQGRLVIDGSGLYKIHPGIRFLDHMLELFARHGGFDLSLRATGDLDVDQHHTVEDLGIVLGEATLTALGKRRGINRAGYFVMPMDETLSFCASATRLCAKRPSSIEISRCCPFPVEVW